MPVSPVVPVPVPVPASVPVPVPVLVAAVLLALVSLPGTAFRLLPVAPLSTLLSVLLPVVLEGVAPEVLLASGVPEVPEAASGVVVVPSALPSVAGVVLPPLAIPLSLVIAPPLVVASPTEPGAGAGVMPLMASSVVVGGSVSGAGVTGVEGVAGDEVVSAGARSLLQ